jgi:succinoglycan biosynthesis transport protein ExoP
MDLRRILQVLKRHLLVVLACAVVGGVSAYVYTDRETRLYESTAEIFVAVTAAPRTSESLLGSNDVVQSRLMSYTQLVSTPGVEDLIREDLDIPDGKPVAQSISAEVIPGSVLLSISVVDQDPQRAAAVANSAAKNLGVVVNELEALGTNSAATAPVRTAVTRAAVPTASAISPNVTRNMALGIGLGLLIGCAVAGLRELLDTRFRTVEELVNATGLTLLGVVPIDRAFSNHPDLIEDAPQSLPAERFRQIRTNLRYTAVDSPPTTIAVVSSMPGEGKTLTAINLASALAQGGEDRVILVDADLRRPSAAQYLGLNSRPGLTDVLLGDQPFGAVLRDRGGVSVLPSGAIPPNPADLVASQQMQTLLSRDLAVADHVVIDCPPLLPVTDAATLAAQVDGVVFVVGMDRAHREEVQRSIEMLRAVDARVLGVVVNRVRGRDIRAYGYRYGYETETLKPTRRRMSKRERTAPETSESASA